MAERSIARVPGRTDTSIFVDRVEEEKCISDRVDGRGLHGCGDLGSGVSGRVLREMKTTG